MSFNVKAMVPLVEQELLLILDHLTHTAFSVFLLYQLVFVLSTVICNFDLFLVAMVMSIL
jgi:hypothetical protein